MTDRNKALETLEALVNEYTYAGVLQLLSGVAYDKAKHLRTNWQAYEDAKLWVRASRQAYNLSTRLEV